MSDARAAAYKRRYAPSDHKERLHQRYMPTTVTFVSRQALSPRAAATSSRHNAVVIVIIANIFEVFLLSFIFR